VREGREGREGSGRREVTPIGPLFFLRLPGLLCLFWLAATAPPLSAGEGFPTFVDVAQESGLDVVHVHGGWVPITILETNEGGVGFVDYDGDGDLDVYAVNGSFTRLQPHPGGPHEDPTNRLYRNDGGRFTDVTQTAGVGNTGAGLGLAVGDYDNDGDPDLYVTNWGPNVMYNNNGDGTFTDVTEAAGVGDTRWGQGTSFGDYDNDGDLDLYVSNYVAFSPGGLLFCTYGPQKVHYGCSPWNYPPQENVLYRNNGDGTFSDVTRSAGVADPEGRGLGAVFGDVNDDGWVDLYVPNDASGNTLFLNRQDGTFENSTMMSGVGFDETGKVQASMGCAFGDYDNDGFPDIFITNYSDETNTLYRNDGEGFFTVRTAPLGLAAPSLHALGWGTGFYDLDHDGYRDLFVANGHTYDVVEQMHPHLTFRQRNQVYRNLEGRTFQDVTEACGPGFDIVDSSRGTAFGDYDNDGDIDILVANSGSGLNLLRNDGGNRGSWLMVRLEGAAGRSPGGTNRDGVGAKVVVTAGGRPLVETVSRGKSYLSVSDFRLHFGLGRAETVERLEVHWPSGTVDIVEDLPARQEVMIREGVGWVLP